VEAGWVDQFSGFAEEADDRRARGRVSRLCEPCARRGLIFVSSVYVHLRSSASKSNVAVQVADVDGIQRTNVLTPENRKVGGSTPPWPPRFIARGVGSLCVLDSGDDL
jgi:hypothetical protein